MPASSVHTVVTSPPYWGLRDYGVASSFWGGAPDCEHALGPAGSRHRGGPPGESEINEGRDRSAQAATGDISTGQFCERCDAWFGMLGLEPTPELYVAHMLEIFREVWRVLRPDGTVWLNLGDCYATGAGRVGEHPGGGEQGARWKGEASRHRDEKRRPHSRPELNGRGEEQKAVGSNRAQRGDGNGGIPYGPLTQPNRMPIEGLKPKDLVMIPARVAMALQASGWWLRQDIVWSKRNCMPESTRDRCTKSHEYIFLLAKSGDTLLWRARDSREWSWSEPDLAQTVQVEENGKMVEKPRWLGFDYYFDADAIEEPAARPDGSGNLERKPASARGVPIDTNGSTAGAVAGSIPWQGDTRNKRSVWHIDEDEFAQFLRWKAAQMVAPDVWYVGVKPFNEAHFATFPPELIEPCILAGCPEGGTVLDFCGGAGTTGLVSDRLHRNAILIELKPEYVEMSRRRIIDDSPLFASVTA